MGGTSAEREVSLNSGGNVLAALRARGVDAQAVDGIPALIASLLPAFDRVFNILHGNKGGGEDGVLQGLLEALRRALHRFGRARHRRWRWTRSAPSRSGWRWACRRRATCAWRRAATCMRPRASSGLPVIVKPSCEGSSVGVSRASSTTRDLDEAVSLAARYPGELLMEQLIEGEELHRRHPRPRSAAEHPHRAGGRVLRLPRQVRLPTTRSTCARAWTARRRRRSAGWRWPPSMRSAAAAGAAWT